MAAGGVVGRTDSVDMKMMRELRRQRGQMAMGRGSLLSTLLAVDKGDAIFWDERH